MKNNNGTQVSHAGELANAYAQLAALNDELKLKESRLLELEQREAYYKGAFHHAAIGMALIAPNGAWQEVNDSICNIVGYTREELMKITFQDITHPGDLSHDLDLLSELLQGKRQSYQMEKRYFHKNGAVIWVLLVVSMVKDREGKLLHFISQIEDITDRKRIEAIMISSEEKYRSLFYLSPVPKWIYDVETLQILEVNEQAINHYGYSRTEFLTLDVKDICTNCVLPATSTSIEPGEESKAVINFTIEEHRHKNGSVMQVEVSVYQIGFEGRNCRVAVCNDVTEKRQAEQALQLSNERYGYVVQATFDAIWDWDMEKDTIYWGNGFQTLFGYDIAVLARDKDSWPGLIHPGDFEQIYAMIVKLLEGPETTWEAEFRFLKSNNEYASVVNKGVIIRNAAGKGVRVIGAMQDITWKKNEERQLKLFESIITNTSDGVMITGEASAEMQGLKIEYVNEAFTSMTGYGKEELIGKTPSLLQGPKSNDNALFSLKTAIASKVTTETEMAFYKKNGEELWVNFSVVPMEGENNGIHHWIAIYRDITHRKRQEAEKEIFFHLIQSLVQLKFDEAWSGILQTVSVYAGFEYAEAWMINIDETTMLLNKRWPGREPEKKPVIAGKDIIKRGEGIAGNAWAKNEVYYANEITRQADSDLAQFAIERKLNSAVYVPILFKGAAIGLLCFYSGSMEIDNRPFKNLFDQISRQLGPYVQSKKAGDELARFFDLTPDLMAIAGTDGYFKKINPSFTRILGYSAEELLQRPIHSFTHPADQDITDSRRKALVEGNQRMDFENRYLTKDGKTKWLSWTSILLPGEGIIFAVAKDTTEKKKLDEERKRILESISDFFFALDKDFNFTYINAATEKLLEIAPGSYIGKNIWKKLPSLKRGVFFENIHRAVLSKERVSFEFYDSITKNWFEESCYPSDDGLSIFFRSINERKTADKALKEAFEEKDTILESIGDAFFTVDKSWTVTYWNKMAEKYLRISKENIIGKNLWELFPEALSTLSYHQYHKAIEQDTAVHFEEYYPPLDMWMEASAYPSNGKLSVYFKDISVRKKAQESIRISNERYNLVAKATNDSIWDWNLVTNTVIRPGNQLETLYGYPACEADEVDNFWNTHAHPEDWERVNAKRNTLFEDANESYWEDEYRFLTAGGEYAYVHDKGYIIRDGQGKAIRMIGASKDITREKEQVKGILRIQQNLDSLINTTTDLIWSVDTNLKIIAANNTYHDSILAITGETIKEGDNFVLPSADLSLTDKWQKLFARAFAGETFDMEESLHNPFVRDPWHTIISFNPIINKDGKISGVACFAKDITELKTAGQKLLMLNNSLEKRAEELAHSNSELERFAYVASHDLQEPLRMISSFLQLLERKYNTGLDETARKYIHFSVDGATRMKQLINDLLHYSRIGTTLVEQVPVNMNTVTDEVLTVFKNEIHTIEAEIIVHPMPVIIAGKSAMFQLVQNLVGNALKYRSSQKPVITISAREEESEWVFTIQDNGIGIDKKFRDKIFIIFQRLHNKDEFGGTGIGLAICKKIIERYNGKIWVESEFGKGSKFIFVIPKIQK